jgi:mRNA interferase MazF
MSPFAAGDIVWTDLDPVFGTEQGGRRPAIVLTDEAFNIRDQRSIICPITRNITPWPTKVLLPEGMKTRGAVLVDQIRSVHRESRRFRFIETAPADLLVEVRAMLGELLGITQL